MNIINVRPMSDSSDTTACSRVDLNPLLNLVIGAEAEAVREEELQKLRQFDLDWRFGPCTGNILTHCRTSGFGIKKRDKPRKVVST